MSVIHPSHRAEFRRGAWIVALLGIAMAAMLGFRLPEAVGAVPAYAPLHTALETVSIAVAVLVFAIGWSSPRPETPRNVVLIGQLMLGAAILDFAHLLSYQGMPDFVTPSDPEKAIAFWFAARALTAAAMLVAAFLRWDSPSRRAEGVGWLVLVLALAAGVHGVVLFHPGVLPRSFVPQLGLTPFKLAVEYVLIGFFLLAALALARQLARPRSFGTSALLAASLTMAMSEAFFTRYVSVTDGYNLVGHLYKITAFFFLYRALVVETVKRPYAALESARDQLAAMLEALPDQVFEVDGKGRVLALHAGREGFLVPSGDPRRPMDLPALLPPDAARTCLDAIAEARRAGRAHGAEITLDLRDGPRAFELSVARHGHEDQERFVVVSRDVTERKAMQWRIQRLAYFDTLTDLPNRSLLLDRLEMALRQHDRMGEFGAVLFIDLDDFKKLNDAEGHAAGDTMLQDVAERLQSAVREADTISRYGGDEFVVVLGDLGPDATLARANAHVVAERIRSSLAAPFSVGVQRSGGPPCVAEHRGTASIGIALFKRKAESKHTLLQRADAAMYEAKQSGGNAIRFAA